MDKGAVAEYHHGVRQDDDQRKRIEQLLEADHRANGRTRRSHTVQSVPHTTTDFTVKTTSGGVSMKHWRSVQLEDSEPSLGHTGQRRPQRGEGVSGPRPATVSENLAMALKLLS